MKKSGKHDSQFNFYNSINRANDEPPAMNNKIKSVKLIKHLPHIMGLVSNELSNFLEVNKLTPEFFPYEKKMTANKTMFTIQNWFSEKYAYFRKNCSN